MKRYLITLTLGLAAALAAIVAPTARVNATDDPGGSLAWFEGRIIDLSESWEEATACGVLATGNRCFRTAEELYEYVGAPSSDLVDLNPLASCSTVLYLWDGSGQSGAVLALNTRQTYIDLVTYSFASRTSSYQIGNCSATFWDSSWATYPGNTSAGASASSMVSVWNNRVSIVYIY